MPTEKTDEWYRQRLTEMSAINSQTVNLDVVGRFNLYVGNVIELVVPVTALSGSESTENAMRNKFDRTLSGRYLVTGLKHMLTRERHTMTIQANKDSIIGVKD